MLFTSLCILDVGPACVSCIILLFPGGSLSSWVGTEGKGEERSNVQWVGGVFDIDMNVLAFGVTVGLGKSNRPSYLELSNQVRRLSDWWLQRGLTPRMALSQPCQGFTIGLHILSRMPLQAALTDTQPAPTIPPHLSGEPRDQIYLHEWFKRHFQFVDNLT